MGALLESWKRSRSRWEFPFFQCSWVGGEPLLRPEVIERCRKYFRYNLVVTTGTLPLPNWAGVDFYVSIDGDEEVHEDLRQRDFYTPMEGIDDPLWISWQDRDPVIDRLLILRRNYPDSLRVTERALWLSLIVIQP